MRFYAFLICVFLINMTSCKAEISNTSQDKTIEKEEEVKELSIIEEEEMPKEKIKSERSKKDADKINHKQEEISSLKVGSKKTEIEDLAEIKENNSSTNADAQPPKESPIINLPVETEKVIEEKNLVAFDHSSWDELLRKYVSNTGEVNYSGFKQEEAKLDVYLNGLVSNPPKSNWSSNKIKAYWVNVYNAYTIKLILKHWPVKSIMDIEGGKAWDLKWIEIDRKKLSLNNVEHDILRPGYKDARIHFAVNCAAKSCPPIWNRAWSEANIEVTLQKKTKEFINNDQYNTIQGDKLEISKIFEWYAEDFGDITTYLNKYSKTPVNQNAQLQYRDYNWALNQ